MLAKQVETWTNYPAEVRDAMKIIVVDDCSPEPAEDVIPRSLGVSLYRIDKDVPWNRGMARNLATKMAETEWVLHVDTDHVLPPASAELLMRCFSGTVKPGRWFRFERWRIGAADETRKKDKVDPAAQHVKIHPHIDSYLCTKTAYWKAGGYNTRFSGVLGGGSPFLAEMVKENGEPAVLPISLDVYTRHMVPDSSERTLDRDPKHFKRRKAEIMKKYGTLRADPREALVPAPWHRVF